MPHEQHATKLKIVGIKRKTTVDNSWDKIQAQNLQQRYEEWKKVDKGQKIAETYRIHKKWDIWTDTECECDSCKQKLRHPKLPHITSVPQAIDQVADGITDIFRKQYIGTKFWGKLKVQINRREVCIYNQYLCDQIIPLFYNIMLNYILCFTRLCLELIVIVRATLRSYTNNIMGQQHQISQHIGI